MLHSVGKKIDTRKERKERGENKNIGEAMAVLRRRLGKRGLEG